MYNSGKVIAGIIVFLGFITFPFWYNHGRATTAPKLEVGTQEKQCVEDTAYMKSSHMLLLNEWRDDVIRRGERTYTSKSGKKWDKSLQNTCMKCHKDKTKFCDRCHNYVEATPNCWDCHLAPVEQQPQKQALKE